MSVPCCESSNRRKSERICHLCISLFYHVSCSSAKNAKKEPAKLSSRGSRKKVASLSVKEMEVYDPFCSVTTGGEPEGFHHLHLYLFMLSPVTLLMLRRLKSYPATSDFQRFQQKGSFSLKAGGGCLNPAVGL